MAASREEIDLIVNAITKGFDKLQKDVTGVGNAVEKSGNEAKSGGLKWTELSSALSIAQQGFQVVAQVAQTAYAVVSEGAQLELARNQFDNLAESIGTTSDSLLNDLQRATKGMVSDAELISGATDIINLGLGKTQEETVRLATAVSTLGLDMQQVILTFANNSKARLDALGLSIEDVDAKVAELNAQGFKGDAFDEAVLIGLEEKMTLLGDASATTAGQLQMLEADWKNLTDGFKQDAAEIAGPVVSAIVKNREASALLRKEYEDGRLTYLEFQQAVSALDGTLQGNNAVLREYGVTVKDTSAAQAVNVARAEEMNRFYADQRAIMNAATQEIRDYHQAAAEAAGVNEDLADKTAQASAHTAEATGIRQSEVDMLREANAANAAYFDGLEETAAAELAAAEAAKAHAASMGDLFRQAIDTDGAIGLFNETAAQMSDRTIYVSNLTRDQRGALSDLQAEYEKAQGIINDYTIGAKGVGLTTEEVNEKVAEQQERMAELQAAMEPLLAVGGEYAAVQGTMTINQDALNQAIFDAADSQGASAEQLAILGGALGLYSDEAVEAALKTALIQAKIDELTAAWLENGGSVQDLRADILEFVASLDEVPGSVTTDVSVTGVDEAINKVGSLQAQLNQLGNQLTPAEAAGAGQKEGGGVYAAGGADFVVPPGYPNDSFGPIWAQSGEQVQITPAGQTTNNSNSINLVQNFFGGGQQTMSDARNGTMQALKEAGITGFG